MNFNQLKSIKEDDQVSRANICKLDDWLARAPYRDRGNLNYMKFADDCNLDSFTAFSLFAEAKRVNVLASVLRVNHSGNGQYYERLSDVPKGVSDYEIELSFKLVAHPNKSILTNQIKMP